MNEASACTFIATENRHHEPAIQRKSDNRFACEMRLNYEMVNLSSIEIKNKATEKGRTARENTNVYICINAMLIKGFKGNCAVCGTFHSCSFRLKCVACEMMWFLFAFF